jgi:hypothetical protein
MQGASLHCAAPVAYQEGCPGQPPSSVVSQQTLFNINDPDTEY